MKETKEMKEQLFFICKHCGNLVGMIDNKGVKIICCGEEMEQIKPNSIEAATEKHLPIIKIENGIIKINIGSINHPMLLEHHIEWVYLQTEKGGQRKQMTVGGDPSVEFLLTEDDKAVAAYSYCNLHGLWKTDID